MTGLAQAAVERAAPAEAEAAASRRNAIRRLVRCLFAEGILDMARLRPVPGGGAQLALDGGRHLSFAELTLAPARTVIAGGAVALVGRDGRRQPVDHQDDLLDLLAPLFDAAPSAAGMAALKKDVADSVGNDVAARRARRDWNRRIGRSIRNAGEDDMPGWLRRQVGTRAGARAAAVLLDQWGALEGHPFYPTWKSRPGLSAAEVAALSPEFEARVPVRIAALRADMAHVETVPGAADVHAWFAASLPQVAAAWRAGLARRGLEPSDWLPLPIHGWHLESFVRTAFAAEVAEGVLILDGPDLATAPSMSFRTMMPEAPEDAPFIKLPIALWMTSEQRSLQAKSIHMGPRNSAVIEAILAREGGFGDRLAIYPEEVAYHYRHAVRRDDAPGRNLSVVFRGTASAFAACRGDLHVPVAALFTGLPETGRPFVTALVGGQAPAALVERFFRRYAATVLRPVLAIYLLYGIGLEAHQQNTGVVFDADGLARLILVRDFGDGRTYAPLLEGRGLTIRPYVNPPILPTVFRDSIAPVRALVMNACFVCHLHELALTLTREYALPGTGLWDILAEETEAAFAAVRDRVEPDFWAAERRAFLAEPWTARSLLRMHLSGYADYRLEHALPNPLDRAQRGA